MDKLLFELPHDDWHGYSVESLWATKLQPNLYRLENTPFFAHGLSFQDQVSARSFDQGLYINEVLRPSGASTYRIIPARGTTASQFQKYWKRLEEKGCSFEAGDFGFVIYAVHVPANVDLISVYDLLQIGEDKGVWDFEEGHCGHRIIAPNSRL